MRCLERSPTERMLAFAVTARSWFAARPDGTSRIDGTDHRPVWFRRAGLGRIAPKNMKSCDATARVSTEQTRIKSLAGRRTEWLLRGARNGSIAIAWHGQHLRTRGSLRCGDRVPGRFRKPAHRRTGGSCSNPRRACCWRRRRPHAAAHDRRAWERRSVPAFGRRRRTAAALANHRRRKDWRGRGHIAAADAASPAKWRIPAACHSRLPRR